MPSKPIYTSPVCSCIICKHITSIRGIHSHYRVVHTDNGKQSHAEISKKASISGGHSTSKNTKS
jgi:hypothetical protein